jgi:hypothetical protein
MVITRLLPYKGWKKWSIPGTQAAKNLLFPPTEPACKFYLIKETHQFKEFTTLRLNML